MNVELICTACGTQYPASFPAEENCLICADDRQYVPEQGQTWTTLSELKARFAVVTRKLHESLYELKMTPSFGIGQRALLVLSPQGNILWDCISLLDEQTIAFIQSKGGLKAIAISHPHYYTTMRAWAETFDCPVYIHEKDQQWIFDPNDQIRLWEGGKQALWDGLELLNIGGHFPGSCIMRVAGISPKGAILCGDTFYISPSKQHVAAMYSYPNRIPLPLSEIRRIEALMRLIEFDAIYGFYDYQDIHEGAKRLLENSLERYC